ncbi:HNH endonuclease [Arcicella aurantiaca]|uniref:HNH endonuclease n=1 Tax=Arcicella aurantiaca TaxID=591202 RepID=A0A316EY89_9BACT|nr:HNH endonuclease [Arcicella aurantiaca]PWK28260.1 HNH endonuclease [Arcicella aurantiaca]
MAKYYIKKLGFQELGSPKPDGSVSRGRYIYVSKQVQSFFPQLSKVITNDAVVIPIVPFFKNEKVYSWYVYHNDKYNQSNGTRDEFRIYLNKLIDPNKLYQPNDIVVFERVEQNDNELMPLYFMYRFDNENENYHFLTSLITNSKIKGGHALFEGDLPFIEHNTNNVENIKVIIANDAEREIVKQQDEILQEFTIANDTTKQQEENLEENENYEDIEQIRGAHLFNSVSFRDFVLLAYDYKCAITEKVIYWNSFYNLEAAHIKPKAHLGTFLPCNGIALCRDMHWAFDKGFITIDNELKVIVHEDVKNTLLNEYHGKKIIVPKVEYFQPSIIFLKHHQTNVFGMFKYSGMIRKI